MAGWDDSLFDAVLPDSLINLQLLYELQASSFHFCVCVYAGGLGPESGDKIRVFRAEKSYAVTQGKWYFEFEAVTVGEMRVGWARPSVRADTDLGADEFAYVFNGFKVGARPRSHACKVL